MKTSVPHLSRIKKLIISTIRRLSLENVAKGKKSNFPSGCFSAINLARGSEVDGRHIAKREFPVDGIEAINTTNQYIINFSLILFPPIDFKNLEQYLNLFTYALAIVRSRRLFPGKTGTVKRILYLTRNRVEYCSLNVRKRKQCST